MNKQELGFTLRAVGRYVRKLMAPVSAEVADVRREVSELKPVAAATAEARKLVDVANGFLELTMKRVGALEDAKPAVVNVVKGDPGPAPTDEQISAAVARYLVANPPPKGDPGASIKGEPGASVKGDPGPGPTDEQVAGAVARYLTANPPPRGEPGASVKGDPGKDAPAITSEQLAEAVARYLAAHPAPRGEPGPAPTAESIAEQVARYLTANPPPRGEPGPAPTAESIGEQVARYLQLNPPPRGEPGASVKGEPGKDATIDPEQLVKLIDEACERRMAVELLALERRFNEHVRAFDEAGRKALADLPKPKDGVDGVNFEDLQFDYDGERTVRATFTRGGVVLREYAWRFPVPIDRGYWKENFRAQKGDAVTCDGSLFIALRDTSEKPSLTADKDWRIGARKGRDAK